jgi:HPt (histidine-containing phosphotransfer) domain-containing protein
MNFKEIGKKIGLDEEEYIEMIELFVESGGEDLNSLEAAIKDADAEKAHKASHSIKGSSGSLMLDTIYEIAKSMDDMLRTGKVENVGEMLNKLKREYETVKMTFLEKKKSN